MITLNQKKYLIILFSLLAIDAAISIYGATFNNATFYEANPILAATHDLTTFTYVVIITKVLAIIAILLTVSYCNKEDKFKNGIRWGNRICAASVIVMGVSLISIISANVIINL